MLLTDYTSRLFLTSDKTVNVGTVTSIWQKVFLKNIQDEAWWTVKSGKPAA